MGGGLIREGVLYAGFYGSFLPTPRTLGSDVTPCATGQQSVKQCGGRQGELIAIESLYETEVQP